MLALLPVPDGCGQSAVVSQEAARELRDGGHIGPWDPAAPDGHADARQAGPGGQGHPLGLPEPVGDADRHIVLTGLEEHSRHASQIIGQDE